MTGIFGLISLLVTQLGAVGAEVVIAPSVVILGDSTEVRASGLTSGGTYSIEATIHDEWGRTWRSSASFAADQSGQIRLVTSEAFGGSYEGVDGGGLFWSASPVGDPALPAAAARRDTSTVVIRLYDGARLLDQARQIRLLVDPAVKETPVSDEGLAATLFEPGVSSGLGVVVVGGSGGGIGWATHTARLLASHGHVALAVAYFNMPSLRPQLNRIPVEYVESAIEELRGSSLVDEDRIVIVGYSKGAEYALVSAALLPAIRGVAVFAPSHAVFQSFAPPEFPQTSSWTFRGRDLPFVTTYLPRGVRSPSDPIERWHIVLHNQEAVRSASIAVERIQGPVLLLSGRSDRVWPSAYMADMVAARLRDHEFDAPYEHVRFDNAGHAIARPGYDPVPAESVRRNGGTRQGTDLARRTGWRKLLEFLAGV